MAEIIGNVPTSTTSPIALTPETLIFFALMNPAMVPIGLQPQMTELMAQHRSQIDFGMADLVIQVKALINGELVLTGPQTPREPSLPVSPLMMMNQIIGLNPLTEMPSTMEQIMGAAPIGPNLTMEQLLGSSGPIGPSLTMDEIIRNAGSSQIIPGFVEPNGPGALPDVTPMPMPVGGDLMPDVTPMPTLVGGDLIPFGPTDQPPEIIGRADFNQDGQLDLLLRSPIMGEIRIAYVNQFGGDPIVYGIGIPSSNWTFDKIADMDQDQFPDVVWRDVNSGQLTTWSMKDYAYITGWNQGYIPSNWPTSTSFTGTADRLALDWQLNLNNA
jgi:hypothetical protein